MNDEALEWRVSALERKYDELHELVDGESDRSHRRRLNALEDDRAAVKLAGQALAHARSSTERRFREWGMLAIAIAAILVNRFA